MKVSLLIMTALALQVLSEPIKLVLIRHGESEWNKLNLFTGWTDVPLSDKGHEEAIQGGKLLKEGGYKFDVCYTSVLKRAIQTAYHVLEEMDQLYIPVYKDFHLNERHYGALQGLNKKETAEKYGSDKVKAWRRSFDIPPPALEENDQRNPANQEIYKEVIKDKMKDYDVSEGEEIIIKGENNFFYQITTSENDKNFLDEMNNKTNQFSKIDLGECENYLKDHYHINRNISLIIVKFEKMTNNSLERSLQYEVYEPFNKTKLNLSICSNTSIDIYVPMILSEELNNLYNELKDLGYDLFDEKSDFYQDICTPFKSPNGTDVLLSDRYNYYFNNHETVCQSNCKFSDYSIESQYLKCECDVSNSKIDTEDVKKFTPKTLYESFYDILKFSNYKVLKCYKLAFSMNSLKINKGSIITIVYFTIYLVFLIIYCIKGINRLKIDLSKKIFNNNSLKLSNDLNGNNNIQIWKNSVDNFDFSNANSSNEINSNKNNGRLKSKNVLIKNDLKK